MNYKMIIALVNPDITNQVVKAAREAGATGDVILSGRGCGVNETKSFLGLTIEDHTEIILFLVDESVVDGIMKAIRTKGEFIKPGHGLAFVIDVEKAVGLESQIEEYKKHNEDS